MLKEQGIFMDNVTVENKGAWYLLQCKPREERRAKLNLQNQGLTVFLPEMPAVKKTKKGFSETEEVLFPGYLFINLNKTLDNWFVIRSTRGVSRLVSFGQVPAKIPEIVIDRIKVQTQINDGKQLYPFDKGDKVIITTGPFKDLQAVFGCRQGQQRAWVFLELLGKWQRLEINDTELNAISKKAA